MFEGAQVCREAGGRVGVDRFVFGRDLDLGAFNDLDQRRIEVIVDGLTLHGDATARRNAATTSGVALRDDRRAKERTYPELEGEAKEGGPGWLCWRLKWGVGGPRKLHCSSELRPRPGRKSHPSSCRVKSQQHT